MKSRKEVFEKVQGVRLLRRDQHWFSRALNWISPNADYFWMTFRFPFCKSVIVYPTKLGEGDPLRFKAILKHELVHVEQFKPWYGPLWMALLYALLPLPVLFSGRWFVEREAYLVDIEEGHHTPESAADNLWRFYFYPWPRSWMAKWFERNRK